jgi:hypothetical protein
MSPILYRCASWAGFTKLDNFEDAPPHHCLDASDLAVLTVVDG